MSSSPTATSYFRGNFTRMAGVQVVPDVHILPEQRTPPTVSMHDINIQEDRLGEGTYATVHRANFRHPQNIQQTRVMALKTSKERKTAWDQLVQEIRIMSQLTHPNVVEFIAKVEHESRPEFAAFLMELAFDSAFSVCKNKRNCQDVFNLWSEQGVRLILCHQLIHAVEYIHKQGIVHGDISCNNVLLSYVNDSLMVKLSDFGSGVVHGETPRFIMGTEGYCAEEVFRKKGCTQASDVFSLAATFYFIKYRRHPAPPGEVIQANYAMHGGGRPGLSPFTRRSRPRWDLNDPLEALLNLAMDPVPENRPSVEKIAWKIG